MGQVRYRLDNSFVVNLNELRCKTHLRLSTKNIFRIINLHESSLNSREIYSFLCQKYINQMNVTYLWLWIINVYFMYAKIEESPLKLHFSHTRVFCHFRILNCLTTTCVNAATTKRWLKVYPEIIEAYTLIFIWLNNVKRNSQKNVYKQRYCRYPHSRTHLGINNLKVNILLSDTDFLK